MQQLSSAESNWHNIRECAALHKHTTKTTTTTKVSTNELNRRRKMTKCIRLCVPLQFCLMLLRWYTYYANDSVNADGSMVRGKSKRSDKNVGIDSGSSSPTPSPLNLIWQWLRLLGALVRAIVVDRLTMMKYSWGSVLSFVKGPNSKKKWKEE